MWLYCDLIFYFFFDKQIETSASVERMLVRWLEFSKRYAFFDFGPITCCQAPEHAKAISQDVRAVSAPLPIRASMLTKKGNCARGVLANVALACQFDLLLTDGHLFFYRSMQNNFVTKQSEGLAAPYKNCYDSASENSEKSCVDLAEPDWNGFR